jgi:hypothetical protein
MPANNLRGAVTHDPLGSRVPSDDKAVRIEHDNGGVQDALYHQAIEFISVLHLIGHRTFIPRADWEAAPARTIAGLIAAALIILGQLGAESAG